MLAFEIDQEPLQDHGRMKFRGLPLSKLRHSATVQGRTGQFPRSFIVSLHVEVEAWVDVAVHWSDVKATNAQHSFAAVMPTCRQLLGFWTNLTSR